MSKRSIFGRSKAIEQKIDEFLDKVSESALVVVTVLHKRADLEEMEESRREQVLSLKRDSSRLRREIEAELYTERLIPDFLGDVAGLIEALHELVEEMRRAMYSALHSRVPTPDDLRADAKELVTAMGNSVEQLVQASRAFFRDFTHVRDYVHKVDFYESESDALRDRLFEKIYDMDVGLAEQDHMARLVREIDGVADTAERIADMLTIYAIKRAE